MSRLVADAGGTNVRFAIADAAGGLKAVRSYRVSDFPTFADALAAYRSDAGGLRDISACAIAAAGPVDGSHVKVTNNDWSIDRAGIVAMLGGVPAALVNDLEAVAAAIPHLTIGDLYCIGEPVPVRPEQRTMLAVNVGTGFGAASVIHRGGRWWTCPSEAGHMTLGPASAAEIELLPKDASVESVLSGKGIAELHPRLAAANDRAIDNAGDAAAVFARAAHDPPAARAVELFTAILARIAGDLALASCAWGGVYLCGSVALGWAPTADAGRFRAEFARKGPMRSRMLEVPTAVIRRDNVALFGLAMMPLSG